MSHSSDPAPPPPPAPKTAPAPSVAEPSVGQLITQLSEQTSRLVRDELRLAQVELKKTAQHAGMGARFVRCSRNTRIDRQETGGEGPGAGRACRR